MAAGRHLGFLYWSKVVVTARCRLSMSTTTPNMVKIAQMAAELLRFVEKFKMAASAILNLYLSILDHPRSSLMALKSHRKFGVNRTFTFQDIAILKFWKFGLKRLFSATRTLSEEYKKRKKYKKGSPECTAKIWVVAQTPPWTDLYQILRASSCPGCVS